MSLLEEMMSDGLTLQVDNPQQWLDWYRKHSDTLSIRVKYSNGKFEGVYAWLTVSTHHELHLFQVADGPQKDKRLKDLAHEAFDTILQGAKKRIAVKSGEDFIKILPIQISPHIKDHSVLMANLHAELIEGNNPYTRAERPPLAPRIAFPLMD